MQLAESQVTVQSLLSLFHNAGIVILDAESDSFYGRGESIVIKISVWPSKKIITYLFATQLTQGTNKDILRKINNMNDTMLFVRFSISDTNGQTSLSADYQMSYDGGILSHHSILMFRRFGSVVVDAINEYILADDVSTPITPFRF